MSTERETLTQLLEWTQIQKSRYIEDNKKATRQANGSEEKNEILSERIGARDAFDIVIAEIQDRLTPFAKDQP